MAFDQNRLLESEKISKNQGRNEDFLENTFDRDSYDLRRGSKRLFFPENGSTRDPNQTFHLKETRYSINNIIDNSIFDRKETSPNARDSLGLFQRSSNQDAFKAKKDLQQVIRDDAENKTSEKRSIRRWTQFFIFSANTIKYFVISSCIPTSLVYWIVQRDNFQLQKSVVEDVDNQILTFVLMFLIIGNIVDNRRKSQKVLLIIFEVLFAVCALILSVSLHGLKQKEEIEQTTKVFYAQTYISYIMVGCGTGIIIISLLQIFHWFPSYALPGLMALWSLSQAMGIILWIEIDYSKNWIKYIAVSGILLIYAIVDWFTYTAYPAQLNLFIGDMRSETDRREREQFIQMENRLVLLEKSKDLNVFSLQEQVYGT